MLSFFREYGHVWHFLRLFKLPYCSLYDAGYTSLGKRSETRPNPALLRKTLSFLDDQSTAVSDGGDADKSQSFWPAYMLTDWSLERAGRGKTPSLASTVVPKTTTKNYGTTGGDDSDGEDGMELHLSQAEITGKIESAGLIIIGDEILNGLTSDVNLQATSKVLQSIGIPLKMVSVIPDDIDEIASEVLRLSQKFDIVITSGGIGPTHDDVTIKAIAKALNQEMKVNLEMLQHLQDIQIQEITNSKIAHGSSSNQSENHQIKTKVIEVVETNDLLVKTNDTRNMRSFVIEEHMESFANLPSSSILRFPPEPDNFYFTTAVPSVAGNSNTSPVQLKHKTWPILQCDNIFILPGVPKYFANKMQLLAKHFLLNNALISSSSSSHYDHRGRLLSEDSKNRTKQMNAKEIVKKEIRKIVLDIEEKALISVLNSLVEKYSDRHDAHRHVKFGSYPFVDHPEYKTIITIESANLNLLDDATSELIQQLPSKSVLRVEKVDFSNPIVDKL
jgi:molybdenum cofactor synthesis domain-containing protein